MSEYQALQIDTATRAEQDRISDYRATGHALRHDVPDFRLRVIPVHATSQAAEFYASPNEVARVRWALSLTDEQFCAATAASTPVLQD